MDEKTRNQLIGKTVEQRMAGLITEDEFWAEVREIVLKWSYPCLV